MVWDLKKKKKILSNPWQLRRLVTRMNMHTAKLHAMKPKTSTNRVSNNWTKL